MMTMMTMLNGDDKDNDSSVKAHCLSNGTLMVMVMMVILITTMFDDDYRS